MKIYGVGKGEKIFFCSEDPINQCEYANMPCLYIENYIHIKIYFTYKYVGIFLYLKI